MTWGFAADMKLIPAVKTQSGEARRRGRHTSAEGKGTPSQLLPGGSSGARRTPDAARAEAEDGLCESSVALLPLGPWEQRKPSMAVEVWSFLGRSHIWEWYLCRAAYSRRMGVLSLSLYIYFFIIIALRYVCMRERKRSSNTWISTKTIKKQTLIRMNIRGHMYVSDRRMPGVHEPVLTRKLLGSPNASSVIYATSRCRLGPGKLHQRPSACVYSSVVFHELYSLLSCFFFNQVAVAICMHDVSCAFDANGG